MSGRICVHAGRDGTYCSECARIAGVDGSVSVDMSEHHHHAVERLKIGTPVLAAGVVKDHHATGPYVVVAFPHTDAWVHVAALTAQQTATAVSRETLAFTIWNTTTKLERTDADAVAEAVLSLSLLSGGQHPRLCDGSDDQAARVLASPEDQ